MTIDSYQKVIYKIKAADSFKADTIAKMQNKINKEKPEVILHKHKYGFRCIGTAAACLAVILSIVIFTNRQPNTVKNNEINNLPKLTVSNESGGMGFEGYMAYNIEELDDGNPWTPDNQITTMPVFKNTTSILNDGNQLGYLTAGEMLKKAKKTAKAMALNIKEIYTNPTKEQIENYEKKTGETADTKPYEAIAVCDGVKIQVESNGDTRVWYDPAISIPDEYSFTSYETNASQAKDTLSYLIKKYNNIINMKFPALSLFSDYTFEGKMLHRYTAYESDGGLLNKILGYNFDTIKFSPDDDGRLCIIDRCETDLSQVIGNYPIITADEGRKLLLKKHYITTVPEELPDEKYIAKSELVYRKSPWDKVFMPYYRFLVEMPTMKLNNGLKTYGAFYVPAVKGEYLTNMPIWDGSFN